MRKIIFQILLFTVLILPCRAWAVMDKQESLAKFVLANQAYKEGNYQKAIGEYEAILAGQRESGPVYYNLGNAYFKDGKLGYALLNYQRSRQLIPRDSDLNFNFNFAQSLIKKNNEENKTSFLNTLIQGHINFYTIDEMVLFITVLTALGGMLHLFAKFLKWNSGLNKALRGGILILILVQTSGLYLKFSEMSNLAIIVQPSVAKFEPNESGTVHFELSEGMTIKIVNEKDGWLKIKRDDGRLGWVEKKSVERI